jgi:hypothetical protein
MMASIRLSAVRVVPLSTQMHITMDHIMKMQVITSMMSIMAMMNIRAIIIKNEFIVITKNKKAFLFW